MPNPPSVSVVLTTRDRPQFFAIALRCYAEQTYERRELIVVDDGDSWPVERAAVESLGGRLLMAPPGTPLGLKLNLGAAAATGRYVMKMDDDDWYAPDYIDTMVERLALSRSRLCQPTMAFILGFLFFDLATWEVRKSVDNNAPGATLFFAREDWVRRPFRPVPTDEDTWFIRDHIGARGVVMPLDDVAEKYVAIRHRGLTGAHAHTWAYQSNGQLLEDYLRERPVYPKRPDALLPPWLMTEYRSMHERILSQAEAPL